MVIERFKNGDPEPVGMRFRELGRLLPEGVLYQASWMETNGARCYQIMEAPDAGSVAEWTRLWEDLVDFEVIPVLESADFWGRRSE